MQLEYAVIVVGGGPAGMTAALYAARAAKRVLLAEGAGFGGQISHSPRVENYPGVEPPSGSALAAAMADIRHGKTGDIPRHLQNVHADSSGMEREQGYLYPHDFPNHWVQQQYLPDELAGTQYYHFGPNKTEQAARRYWEEIKKPKDLDQTKS